MKKLAKPLGALAFLTLLCLFPEEAGRAARESLRLWAESLAPSLLPYLIALPALSGEEACALYGRLLGRVLPRAGLSAEMAGTAAIGLICGSPAGAASLYQVCAVRPMDRNHVLRCAWFASGASPAFLLTAVARDMLGAPEVAWPLVMAQWSGQLFCLMLFGGLKPLSGLSRAEERAASREGVVWQAVKNLLTIGGYMLFFAVLSSLLTRLVEPLVPRARVLLAASMELAGGCAEIARADWPLPLRVSLASACASLGGLSSCLQAMAFLRPLGIPLRAYLPGKLIQAIVSAGFARLLTATAFSAPAFDPPTACAALALGMLLALWLLRRRARSGGETVAETLHSRGLFF